jgi:hypothetical protein
VQQGGRAFGQELPVARADVGDAADGSRQTMVDGDEIFRGQEEVDVLGLELVLPRAEVDAVQDEVEIFAVRFDLGLMDFRQRILDGELVEMKNIAEEVRFVRRRLVEVHP